MIKKINGASLNAPNLLANPERIDTFQRKIIESEPFNMIDGTKIILKNNEQNIKELNRLRNHVRNSSYSFECKNSKKYKLSFFHKCTEFGSNKSVNSLGKPLADAGERATIASFYREINTPEDTGEELMIQHPEIFNRWKPSFSLTKKAIEEILGAEFENKYDVIHDSTDGGKFSKKINEFCSKVKINKDTWNPSDIWLISKASRIQIENKLEDIIEKYSPQILVEKFNNEIYSMYLSRDIIPISLKQITNTKAQIELANIPGEDIPTYDIEIDKFITNLKLDTKEIGTFSFLNKETNNLIRMQNKGFPFSSMGTQTEIPTDGTITGGRLGKVPASIIDDVYEEFNFSRIKAGTYFNKDISRTNPNKINDWVHWYNIVSSHPKTELTIPAENIEKYIKTTLLKLSEPGNDYHSRAFIHKIQGLAMQYFFIENEKNISEIMTRFILGAKKVDTRSSFFIKVY